ncbi:hypothetical protein [Frigoriglobus tundricola]|uniref:hypothetical protein n=1 Tax=Frigoriglobus tundricola TaxID=2774151 RepID=UPI001D077B35|nr:hypothetical protein [Frigoriglobus tundricola]
MEASPRTSRVREFRAAAGLYALALGVRLAYLFAVVHPAPLVGDEPDFFDPAANLVAGRGYSMVPQQSPDGVMHPTANRPPGPAVVLAGAFAVFGPSVLVARLTCALAASAAAPLVYAVTKRIGGGPRPRSAPARWRAFTRRGSTIP